MTPFFTVVAFVLMTSLFVGLFVGLLVVLLVLLLWISRLVGGR
jgi:hypothetical protein